MVAHPELSLAAGAIRGWDRRNQFYFQMLASLAAHYAFDIEAAFETLPERVRDVVLHGSGKEKIAFRYMADNGRILVVVDECGHGFGAHTHDAIAQELLGINQVSHVFDGRPLVWLWFGP